MPPRQHQLQMPCTQHYHLPRLVLPKSIVKPKSTSCRPCFTSFLMLPTSFCTNTQHVSSSTSGSYGGYSITYTLANMVRTSPCHSYLQSTIIELHRSFQNQTLTLSSNQGTFLFDNEKERVEARAAERTRSVWDYFLCRKEEFSNKNYDPVVDDSVRGKERMWTFSATSCCSKQHYKRYTPSKTAANQLRVPGIIFPKKGEARWWAEFFGRSDEEMNSPALAPSFPSQPRSPSNARSGTSTPILQEPIVTGTESAENATGAGTTAHPMPPTHALPGSSSPSTSNGANGPSPLDAAAAFSRDIGQNLKAGIANLNLGIGSSNHRATSPAGSQTRSRSRSTELRKEIEVEMQ